MPFSLHRSSERARSCCSKRPATAMSSRSTADRRLGVETANAAARVVEGDRARLGAVHPADGSGARRTGVDVRSCDGRYAVAARSCFAGSLVAVLRGVRALARTGSARHDARLAANTGGRGSAGEPRAPDGCDSRHATERQRLARCRRRRARAASGRRTRPTSRVGVLLDLYAGSNSRYLNFYGPARAIQTRAVRPRAHGLERNRLRRQSGASSGMSEPRQPRAARRLLFCVLANTGINLSGVEVGATVVGNLLEQRTLQPLPLPFHVALVALLGVAFGSLIGRLAWRARPASPLRAGALYCRRRVLAVHELRGLAAAGRTTAPAVTGELRCGNLVELSRGCASSANACKPRSGITFRSRSQRRLTDADLVARRRIAQLLHGTCLVTDAEHYTSVSGTLAPVDLAALMNDYYQAIFRVVQAPWRRNLRHRR